jgi:hypothetical protein
MLFSEWILLHRVDPRAMVLNAQQAKASRAFSFAPLSSGVERELSLSLVPSSIHISAKFAALAMASFQPNRPIGSFT